jgi:hypothetical protein
MDRRRRHHHDLRDFRLRRDRRGGERAGREPEAGKKCHLVIHDKFLRQALRDVGIAGVILDDELDLPARHYVAIELHIEARSGDELLSRRGERPGHRRQQADLDGILGESRRCRREQRRCEKGGSRIADDHRGVSPKMLLSAC